MKHMIAIAELSFGVGWLVFVTEERAHRHRWLVPSGWAGAAAIVALTLLAGCAQLGTFTANDATNAAAIDPAHAACYGAIGAVGSAKAAVTGSDGIMTIVATKLALKSALQSPGCAAIEAEVLATILKATPAAPFIP